MTDKKNAKDKIKLTVFAIVLIALIILLGLWTRSIYENARLEEMRSALEAVIDQKGEEGLFQLAGIPTESMNYGNVDLYLNGRGAWTFQESELIDIASYERAKESTVQIISSANFSDESQASGIIISRDGYIVTNKHVLGDDEKIMVNFYDGFSMEAVLIGSDSLTDLAVIKTQRDD